MKGGWVKLFRCLMEKPIWLASKPEQKVILITLLMMANHRESEWIWKGEKYKAVPGQFVTSLDSIVENSGKGISIQNVRTALIKFEKYEFLTNESTKQNRLITIVNWAFYQSNEQELTNQLTDNQQTANRQLTTNKNVRKIIKKEEKSIDFKPLVLDYTSNEKLQEAIDEFIKMRKAIKKPLATERALKGILNKLNDLGVTDTEKIALLDQSITNSWQGIFEIKTQVKEHPIQKTIYDD